MQPNMLASNTPQKARAMTVKTVLVSLLAMLSAPFKALGDAPEVASRRAMLVTRRVTFQNESAAGNPVKDIAIGFILLAVSIMVALAFWPAITSAVATATADANTSDAAGTVLGLIPLILAVALLVGSVAFLFKGIKGLGN